MDLQDAKWRKPVIFGSVFLLLAGGAGAYYAGAAEEPAPVLQSDKHREEQPAEPPEIKGLQQANASQELRNPFSLLHEREGEIAEAGKDGQKPLPATTDSGVATQVAEKQNRPVPKGKQADIVLCGIVEGAGGRLALLRAGSSTVTAGCGEMVAGWQVTAVGAESVTVARAGQVRHLPLAMMQMGAK